MNSLTKPAHLLSQPVALALILICALMTGCANQMKHMDGWDHLQAGDYVTGLNELHAAMAADPANMRYRADWLTKREEVTNILLVRASKAVAAQNIEAAEQIYQTILAYDDTNARAKAGLEALQHQLKANQLAQAASAAFAQGNVQSAQTLANEALSIAPDNMVAKAVKRQLDERDSRDMLNGPSLGNLYKKPITLEFRDTSLKLVFELLSRTTGINFILDREMKTDQHTTIFLKKASLEDALNMLAATNQFEVKVMNASSVLIYPNTQTKSKEYQDLIVRAFYMHSADAKTTSELIKSILKLKDIFVDEKYNMLVVRDSPEAIGLAEKLILLYDLPEPEVMLEVEVLEIDRTFALNMGIQVSDQLTVTPLSALSTGTSNGTTPGTASTSSSQSIASIFPLTKSNVGFVSLPTATISANQQNGDANLLANPRIRVRSHDKAKILIGDKIPLITTTSGNTGFVSENIQYLDVGLKLNVEPVIYPGDEILIKLGLEVSSLGQEVQTKSGSIAYQIGTRSADTVLRLVDGETQILAGLLNNEERSSANGLPGLTSLPIVGRLFSNQHDSHNKTEIVLSITPHLIRGVQRKDPSAEMFWSGTDATLRNKPLQLRIQDDDTSAKAAGAKANPAPDNKIDPAMLAAINSPLKLSWNGPTAVKAGQEIQLDLMIDTSITMRNLPMQIAYDPKMIEVVAVDDGGYFSRDGNQGNLSQTVDKNGGRIAIALGGNADATGSTGKLLSLKVKGLVPGEASLDVTSMTPMGAKQSFAKPVLPVQHAILVQN
ncbi:general secretion pathway protein D [Oxalobacteraceae bacterium GrIS 2.11]